MNHPDIFSLARRYVTQLWPALVESRTEHQPYCLLESHNVINAGAAAS